MTAFLCMLYQRLQVRLDGHFCAVHALADMRGSGCLTIFIFATQQREGGDEEDLEIERMLLAGVPPGQIIDGSPQGPPCVKQAINNQPDIIDHCINSWPNVVHAGIV